MHASKKSLIVLCSIVAIAAFAFVYANRKSKEQTKTNQDPQYLIEARKNIIGVWTSDDNPENKWEFKSDVVLETIRENNGEVSVYSNKIVNTTPVCGVDVDVDEEFVYMYLVRKDIKTGIESCLELRFFPGNKRIGLQSLRMGANGNKTYSKK